MKEFQDVEKINVELLNNGLYRAACHNKSWHKIKGRKFILVSLRGGACEKCGYNENLSALDFHHINSEGKEFNIGQAIRMYSDKHFEEIVIPEVKNHCLLLCSNCHRKLHSTIRYQKKLSKIHLEKIREKGLLISSPDEN